MNFQELFLYEKSFHRMVPEEIKFEYSDFEETILSLIDFKIKIKIKHIQIFHTPYSIQDYFSLSETSSLSLPQNLSTPDTFSIGEKSLSIGLSL